MAVNRWTEDQTKKALFLYFQLPFGQLHKANPEIVALAGEIGRTPSSVAMKLANFASLDPKIVESGRKGLAGSSELDRKIWKLFHADWTRLIIENSPSADTQDQSISENLIVREHQSPFAYSTPEGMTSKPAQVERRIGQNFFRRAVLANFDNSCCVTGIREPRVLVASHISAWNADVANRHNPRNGLCLSATFDRAFDAFLMTVTPDMQIKFSTQLLDNIDSSTRDFFIPFEGRLIISAKNISLDKSLLENHNSKLL